MHMRYFPVLLLKRIACLFLVPVLIVELSLKLIANEVPDLETARPVYPNTGQHPIWSMNFSRADTRLVYPSANGQLTVNESTTMVLLFFPGTGADPKSEYGINGSVRDIQSSLSKANIQVIGFENPLYFHFEAEDWNHALHHFGQLEPQLRSMETALRWTVHHLKTQNPAVKIGIAGRSTGAMNLSEIFSRHYHDPSKYEFLSKVDYVFPWALLPYWEPLFNAWRDKQQVFVDDKKIASQAILDQEPRMYSGMSWGDGGVKEFGSRLLTMPKVVFLAPGQDELVDPLTQLGVIRQFIKLHAGAQVSVYGIPTKHNPFASFNTAVPVSGNTESLKEIEIRAGRAVRYVLAQTLKGTQDQTLPGTSYFATPHYLRLIDAKQSCLGGFGSIDRTPLDWQPLSENPK